MCELTDFGGAQLFQLYLLELYFTCNNGKVIIKQKRNRRERERKVTKTPPTIVKTKQKSLKYNWTYCLCWMDGKIERERELLL